MSRKLRIKIQGERGTLGSFDGFIDFEKRVVWKHHGETRKTYFPFEAIESIEELED